MIEIFTKIVEMFEQQPDITKMGFLSTFFKTTPDSFTDSEWVEYDIVRSGAEVAPVVRNLSTGAVTIVEDEFTNKRMPFPVYSLDAPAQLASLMQRMPGESAYQTGRVNWMGRLAQKLVSLFAKMSRMIRYSIELQASQVLQTGTLTLTDEDGNPTYELDFKPKATHFPTVTISWGDTGSDPLADIRALMSEIRKDGYADVKTLVFGETAWEKFYENSWVQENLKRDNLGMGALDPHLVDKGAGYMGYIFVGAYRLDLYVYDAFYTPWGTNEKRNYLDPAKVLFLPSLTQLDFRRFFGGIPAGKVDPVFDPLFGNKIPISNEYDFKARVYFDEKRDTYFGEIKSRPFMCPVSIDRYGCLTTVAAP
ncbi:MAG: major capsid protein [Spirochaetaceae bacterium]|jgi:hypothetical protein|nr:major capsid protein [Spirochaetaceae bacterium]